MDRPEDSRGIRLTGTEQHEHDTLAELFLGDASYAPAPMSGSAPAPGGERPRSGIERSDASSQKPVASRYEGSAVRTMMPSDSESGHDGRPIVEMVVLGHLPVRASLWVRQYACQSSRNRSETVALLRTAGESVAIDLITGGERAEIEPVEDIYDAITLAKAAASRIVVRVDETAEPELLDRRGIDEVTILTGADEAAVVASYRLIKSLVATLEDRLDPDASPLLRVAVMGGAGDDIAAACTKIERACKAFIERPIEILDASGRIDATGTTSVCRIERSGAASEAIDALLAHSDIATGGEQGAMLRLAHGAAEHEDASSDTDSERAPEIVVMPGAKQAFGRSPACEIEPKPALHERGGPDVPTLGKTLGQGDAGFSPDLATAIRPVPKLGLRLPELIEGLTPIETRCPRARGVWFACDEDGGLHAAAMDDIDDPVASLVAARAWAIDNLALLLRAEPGLAMPSADAHADAGVTLHLLTRHPARWRGVFDSEVMVYAVASLTVEGQDHLVATPLND